ncbi:cation:proton antiporter domain-containing protein [Kiloniella sp. b19]|uniref:cation:proton antiporter domain-containing protein n=1 Tax=Kiloniella sp. GXU_MW_B19 TaxID=3141326 RepID=UPI0031E46162
MTDLLVLSFVLLISGVIAVPLASRLGLGSVLGFLLAGVVIAPVLQALHVDVLSLQHFAEFGVVMMLFLVGLELEPQILWKMKLRLLGLGGLQVGLTTAVVMAAAMALGHPWSISLAVGLTLALSSTAIVLQTLNEKGLMKSDGGQSSFSVLLFQDIAVIPMLALLPLLALPELVDPFQNLAEETGHETDTAKRWFETLPGWLRATITAGAIAAVIGAGNFLTRPFFHFVSQARMRELFVATALMMIIGIALLMTFVGLSPALGTFLAGVVLANSEYRHELESNLAPFKGLLLGLFFITVGAGINFELLFGSFFSILGMTFGLIVIKVGILYALALIFKIDTLDRWLFSLGLAQAGEFGFVLLSFTVANAVIPKDLADQLLLVVALSMLLTPLLFIANERFILPRFQKGERREPDEIDSSGPIIIAGHGRFGGIVNRILRRAGHETVVLDNSSRHLEMLRTFGFKAFFGDPTRPELLHAAGIETAKALIIAIDDRRQAVELVHYVHQNHPHIHMVARALDRTHVYELYAAGCRDIVRETFDSGVRAGRYALEAMGMHPYTAQKMAEDFVIADRHNIAEMAPLYDPDIPFHLNKPYVEKARELRKEEDDSFIEGKAIYLNRVDRSWAPPSEADMRKTREQLSGGNTTTDSDQ